MVEIAALLLDGAVVLDVEYLYTGIVELRP